MVRDGHPAPEHPGRIRVLHLLGQREDVGGVLSVVRNLGEATASAGLDHRVWVHTEFQEHRQPRLTLVRSRHAWDEPGGLGSLLLGTLGAVGDLRRYLRAEPVEVLHAHTRGGLLAGLGLWASQRRPLLFTNHAYASRPWLYRWIASLPGVHTVVLSPNMARFYGLPAGRPRLHLIADCCAEAMMQLPLEQRRRPGAQRPVRLVGLGSLLPWKKWHLLLRAMKLLTANERAELRFEHWGAAAQTDESQKYARELAALVKDSELEACVSFRGSTAAVAERLMDSDWMVLPSTNEPCSVALSEALATGTPVLASRSGGNVDIVQEGRNGLLFEPDSAEDLARALRRIIRGLPSLAAPEEIRQSVVSRAAAAVGRSYGALYRELAAARPGGGLPNRQRGAG